MEPVSPLDPPLQKHEIEIVCPLSDTVFLLLLL